MTKIAEELLTRYEGGKIDRRQLLQGLTAALAAASTIPTVARAAGPAPLMKAVSFNHFAITTDKVNETRDFYVKLFGVSADTIEDNKRVYIRFSGREFISVNAGRPGAPPSYNHFALGIEGFDPKNKKPLADKLSAAGLTLREMDAYSLGITDPNGLVI